MFVESCKFSNTFHTVLQVCVEDPLTDLVVSITLMLCRIRLVEFVLELSDQIILCVHDIQVLVLVPVPFVLFILAGAADVVEDLSQFITLG